MNADNAEDPPKARLVTEVWGVFRSFLAARRNLLEIIPEAATRRSILSGRTGGVRWHMVCDPASIRRILKDNVANYPKSPVTKNILEPAIGDSLFVAEGEHWRWQRQAAAPVFTYRNVAALAPIMSEAADAACRRLETCGGKAEMHEAMVRATFDVIGRVTLTGSGRMDSAFVHGAIESYIASTARISLLDIAGIPMRIPRLRQWTSTKPLRTIRRIADEAIAHRIASGPMPVPDVLDALLDGIDPESGRRMNPHELRDNLLAFIVAGHETTALALAWSLFLLAYDPGVQERLRAETIAVLGGRTATAADVNRLSLTRQVIDEALRLYPPAAILSRSAQRADELCGRDIRQGDTIILPIYALHRHHQLWDRPDSFDPDRFSNGRPVDRFAYLPFGDGPRVCIGASFALTEAVIILATLISRFRFRRLPGPGPKPVMILTLRPHGGIHLEVEALPSRTAS
ncbi:MAG: cytochrome P450 [Paracoccaceae bacterium]|nr:cytochrome P450 [Paracoccaceae bacterium]